MEGINIELVPSLTNDELGLNIQEEERYNCNEVKNAGSDMLLLKLSCLEFWLLTMRIIFGQPLLFCYDTRTLKNTFMTPFIIEDHN